MVIFGARARLRATAKTGRIYRGASFLLSVAKWFGKRRQDVRMFVLSTESVHAEIKHKTFADCACRTPRSTRVSPFPPSVALSHVQNPPAVGLALNRLRGRTSFFTPSKGWQQDGTQHGQRACAQRAKRRRRTHAAKATSATTKMGPGDVHVQHGVVHRGPTCATRCPTTRSRTCPRRSDRR